MVFSLIDFFIYKLKVASENQNFTQLSLKLVLRWNKGLINGEKQIVNCYWNIIVQN